MVSLEPSRRTRYAPAAPAPTSTPQQPPSLVYSRHNPPAQRLFAVLTVLPGADHDVTGLAAAMAARTTETAALLVALTAGGLVEERSPGRFRTAPAAAGFRPPQVETRALQRWYDWCLASVTAGAEALYPQALRLDSPSQRSLIPHPVLTTPAQAARWLDAEIENLAAAIMTAHRQGLHRYAWLLADGLRGWSWQVPQAVDWIAVAIAAREAARSAGDGRAGAAAHLCLADASILAGDLVLAVDACTAAERNAARSGWLSGRAAALGNRGGIHRREGRYAEALADYDAALELFGAAGRAGHKAAVYNNVGALHLLLGRPERSAECHRRALAIHRQTGSVAGEARSLHLLAEALRAAGQLDAAERGLLTALAAYAQLGDRSGESVIRAALADLRSDVDLAA